MDETMNDTLTAPETAEDTDPFNEGFGETEDTGEEREQPAGEVLGAEPAEEGGEPVPHVLPPVGGEQPAFMGGGAAFPTQQERTAAMHADIQNFRMAFPEAAQNPYQAIPAEVWRQVDRGVSLTAAYAQYAVAQARGDARRAEQQTRIMRLNQENLSRSTGSMRSAGEEIRVKDPFLEGWDNQ